MAQNAFRFPILKMDEIIGSVADLEFTISKEDLQHPTPDRARALYKVFIQQLLNIDPNSLGQPKFDAIDELGKFQPILHERSAETIGFLDAWCAASLLPASRARAASRAPAPRTAAAPRVAATR